MGATMSLVDGSTTIPMVTSNDRGPYAVYVKDWDLGFPDVREVKSDLAGQSGILDSTAYHGARVVKLNVMVFDQGATTKHQTLDKLRAACHPSHRPVLTVLADGWTSPRSLTLRGQPMSCVVGQVAGAYAEASLSWVCPSGVAVSAVNELVIQPVSGAVTGLSAPLSAPISCAPGSLLDTNTATNAGTEPMPWTARFYGTATTVSVINKTTSQMLTVATSIPNGHYLALDSAARTALLDGDPSNSAFGSIDFTQSGWWTLAPGDNSVRVTAGSADTHATCFFDWQSGWI